MQFLVQLCNTHTAEVDKFSTNRASRGRCAIAELLAQRRCRDWRLYRDYRKTPRPPDVPLTAWRDSRIPEKNLYWTVTVGRWQLDQTNPATAITFNADIRLVRVRRVDRPTTQFRVVADTRHRTTSATLNPLERPPLCIDTLTLSRLSAILSRRKASSHYIRIKSSVH